MTDEEWRAFLERWNATPEEERNETLYFKPDTIMMEGRVVEVIHCGAKLRLKAGEGKLEESFLRPAQLRTKAEYEVWKAKLRAEGKIHTQICVICGTAFETRGKAKVCSEECQHTWKQQAARKRKKKGSGITLTSSMTEDERKRRCPECGMAFRARTRRQVCCCKACGLKYQRKEKAKERAKMKDASEGSKL